MIVGLGNPGPKYKYTRHNVGFLFVDRLISLKRAYICREFKKNNEYEFIELDDPSLPDCVVIKPLTYMNLSGKAVKKLSDKFNIPPEYIFVVHDDLDISFGRMKLKFGGGIAGHRGLKSIVESLETRDFYRLRIGIDRPRKDEPISVRDYVLSPFSDTELKLLTFLLDKAIEGMYLFFQEGYDNFCQVSDNLFLMQGVYFF
jgi:PTH1 family peptidyl-tRNA hydrolase